jgi:HEAT repeat protein
MNSSRDLSLKRSLPWLISVANLLLKGTSNLLYIGILSVFLKHFGADFLPWFYIILNVSFIGFQFFVTPFLMGREGHPLLIVTQIVTLGLTMGASVLIDSKQLYILIGCLAMARLMELITSQAFSAMNNELLSIQESKAYLSYIYAAGSIGYILSGLLLKLLIDIVSFNKLLLLNGIVVSGLILTLAYIGRVASVLGLRAAPKAQEQSKTKGGPSQPTYKQGLARNLSLAAFLIVFNTFMVDFLYSGVISSHFTSSDTLASFMGVFGATTDLSIIVLQATVMNWVFSTVPMGRMLVAMPAALTMLCLAFWVSPSFAVVVAIQYLVMANSRMLTQPSTVIYMGALKQSDRIYYRRDMSVMSSLGSLLVGIMLIFTKNIFSTKILFVLVGVFYVVLSYLHSKLDKSYSDTLQDNLLVDEDREDQNWHRMLDFLTYEDRLNKITIMLESKDPKIRLASIKACFKLKGPDVKRLLQRALLAETENSCILEITRVLMSILGESSWELIAETIEGTTDERLVADIVEAIGLVGKEASFEKHLLPFMDHEHHRVRSNAIMSVLRLSFSKEQIMLSLSRLVEMTKAPNRLYRAAAAGVMGELQLPLFVSALEDLGADSEASVNKTAAFALYKIRTPRCIKALEQMILSPYKEVSELASRLHEEASAANVKRINALLHSLNENERNRMISELKRVGLRGVSKTAVKILELKSVNNRHRMIRLLSSGEGETAELVDRVLEALKEGSGAAFTEILNFLEETKSSPLLEAPIWLPLVETLGEICHEKKEQEALATFFEACLKNIINETLWLSEYFLNGAPVIEEKEKLFELWQKHLTGYVALMSSATQKPRVAISAYEGISGKDSFSASLAEELMVEIFGKEFGGELVALGKVRQRGQEGLSGDFCKELGLGEAEAWSSVLLEYLKNGEAQ